ncbi:TetR/AcrR family transcriptional regulator [Streptomyces sp. NPDC059740]|uniref:TetR/AcrR family transcriptional regulator n=1 Tax=Streptomyces sp. NPDC059740 TaxID=3346926 RepID=UPI003653A4AA
MATRNVEPEAGPRSKRAAILTAAVDCFGETSFESTKWAAVSERVGIGQTALYHYFESKTHCLLTIMRLELQRSHEKFTEATEGVADPVEALRAAVRAAYDVSDREVLQMRILHNHMDLLSGPRKSKREEAERVAARQLVQLVERDWTNLLVRGMSQGAFPLRDAQLLGAGVLGLIVSVWRWYRPSGPTPLSEISDLIEGACVRMAAM